MYLHEETGAYPVTEKTIRDTFPNTSFPTPFVAPAGYVEVAATALPTYDPIMQAVREAAPLLMGEKYLQQWEVYNLDATAIAANQAVARQAAVDVAKFNRQSEVDNLKVTVTTGKVFDGNESAQSRMARAIIAADITGLTECVWVLADSTPATVTLTDLKEALALSIQAQGAVWARPYL